MSSWTKALNETLLCCDAAFYVHPTSKHICFFTTATNYLLHYYIFLYILLIGDVWSSEHRCIILYYLPCKWSLAFWPPLFSKCVKQEHPKLTYRQSIHMFAFLLSPLPTHMRTHTNSLKDQPLIFPFSPAWAIISLIIQNPSSAQWAPSTRKVCVFLCFFLCLSLGVWGCVTG